MIRALELFWMALTVVGLVGTLFFTINNELNEALILLVVTILAGFRYYMRRRLRIRMEQPK